MARLRTSIYSTWFLIERTNQNVQRLNASNIIPRVCHDYKSTVLRKRRGCSRWEMQIRWRNNLWACKLSGKVGRSRARCKPRARTDGKLARVPATTTFFNGVVSLRSDDNVCYLKKFQFLPGDPIVPACRNIFLRDRAQSTVLRASISVSDSRNGFEATKCEEKSWRNFRTYPLDPAGQTFRRR